MWQKNTLDFKNAKSETAGIDKIKYTIGPQITGYLVDLAKENPELATKYITEQLKNNTKYYKVSDHKLYEISKEEYDKEEKWAVLENIVRLEVLQLHEVRKKIRLWLIKKLGQVLK